MDKVAISLTVLFEKPFWIGVFEKNENDLLSVSKIMFGSEPKENEIYAYVLHNFNHVTFCSAITNVVSLQRKRPKRMQRDVKKELLSKTIGTKSQLALKLQHEQMKIERKADVKRSIQLKKERLFNLKQQKRKAKHKGR